MSKKILYNRIGYPIDVSDLEDIEFSMDGFINRFKDKRNNTTYSFFTTNELKIGDKDSPKWKESPYSGVLSRGFYPEEKALAFINEEYDDQMERYRLNKLKYSFPKWTRPNNEVVEVVLNHYNNHDYIQQKRRLSFNNTGRLPKDENDKFRFPFKGEEGFGDIQEVAINENWLESQDEIKKSAGFFYKLHFVDKKFQVNSESLQELNKYTTLICVHIVQIRKEIFPWLFGILENRFKPFLWIFPKEEVKNIKEKLEESFGVNYNPNAPEPYVSYLGNKLDINIYKAKYVALNKFYRIAYFKSRGTKSTTEKFEEFRIIRLFFEIAPEVAFTVLSLSQRIGLINYFIESKFLDVISNPSDVISNSTILNENLDVILKIVSSVEAKDATSFMTQLIGPKHAIQREEEGRVTLFQRMYEHFDIDKEKRKKLIKNLYLLWYVSDWRKSNGVDNFNSNNPVFINYTSRKVLGFYFDNMNFEFKNDKIEVVEKLKIEFNNFELNITPQRISLYSLYQTVLLFGLDANNIAVNIPAIAITDSDSNITMPDSFNFNIPLFFLKHLDDVGDDEDFWKGISLVIDVATTFTGFGNLAKLRHLRQIGKLGTALSTPNKSFVVWKILEGTSSVIDITAGFLQLFITYYSDGCKVYKNHVKAHINDDAQEDIKTVPEDPNDDHLLCKTMDKFLFWLQIGAGGMEVLASSMIRKQAKVLDSMTLPSDWDASVSAKIKELAELEKGFLDSIPQQYKVLIEDKLNTFNVNAKSAFVDDFAYLSTKNNNLVWDELAKSDILANWNELRKVDFPYPDRINIEILRDNNLSQSFFNYYSQPDLKKSLDALTQEQKVEFIKKYGNQSELRSANFIEVWKRLANLKEGKTLDEIKNNEEVIKVLEATVDQKDFYDDDLLDAFFYEVTHPKRGAGVRTLISNNPTDIQEVVLPMLTKPDKQYEILKTQVGPRWEKWRKTQFYKFWFGKGKKFESFVNTELAKRNTPEYNLVKSKVQIESNKNLDEFELFTQVQLKYDNDDYFIGDQIYIKYEFDALCDINRIVDVVILETKLQSTTGYSYNQIAAFIEVLNNPNHELKVRSINPQSLTRKNCSLNQNVALNLGGNASLFKIADFKTGEKIKEVTRIELGELK